MCLVNAKNKQNGQTVLHVAAQYKHADCVQSLIDCGANVYLQDKQKQSALHIACTYGDLATVKILCDAGESKLMLLLDKLRRPAILLAAKNGHFEIVKYMLQQGNNNNNNNNR